jgi:hypothetical protein
LFFLVLVFVAVFFGIRYRREILQSLRDAWNAWLGWFPKQDRIETESNADEIVPSRELPVAFASLMNPFELHRTDSDRLVRGLFLATTTWGREHRVERREDETPEEYLRRLGRKYNEIAELASQLGMIYSRLAYAQKSVRREEAQALRPLWDWMTRHPAPATVPAAILKDPRVEMRNPAPPRLPTPR